MNIGRIIASTVVRWLTLLALVAILGWLGLGKAHAATYAQAQAACQAWASGFSAPWTATCVDLGLAAGLQNNGNFTCAPYGSSTTQGWIGGNRTNEEGQGGGCTAFGFDIVACVAPQVYSTISHQCETPCGLRPDSNFLGWNLDSNDVVCHDGCEWVQLSEAAGGTQSPLGDTCSGPPSCGTGNTLITVTGAPSQVCRPTDTDGDGIPDSEDEFPGDPFEDTDSDGDGTGDNGDHAPNDPTDGKDEDEEGGDEGDNVSHGGGNCATRPVSTGDGILSQIAIQTWETRCAIERLTNADGELKTDAGSALAIGGGGTDLDMSGSTPEGLGDPTAGGEHPSADDLFENAGLEDAVSSGPDMSGIGSMSRVCPMLELPDLELSFGSASMPWPMMCTALEWLASLIVLAGTIQWALIIGRAGT